MTPEEAIKIIKSECYVANLMNLDRTRMVNSALDVAIQALEYTELNPSYNSVKTELEQQSRWIPVSQGLPEDARNVLITVNPYGMVVPGWYSNESKLWYRLSQGRWAEVIDTECDVIAWQYFPEPYKEDSNGSES